MYAGVAQLVEYKLPKLGVASSNLVARSSVTVLMVAPLMRYHGPEGLVAFESGLCPLFFMLTHFEVFLYG